MAQIIPAIIGGAGSIVGMLGQRKQQKQNTAYTNRALGTLGAMGDTGYGAMTKARDTFEGMLSKPEEWTGGTAAELGQQTQQQLGSLSRTVGRSGAAGASARDLLTENTKNNMQTRLKARLGALGGMTNLSGQGIQALHSQLGGASAQGGLQLDQGKQNQDIFGGMGGSLFDIFKGLPKKGNWGSGPISSDDPRGGGIF